MSDLTQQILLAVQDDQAAITNLASAIARGDTSDVQSILSARGLHLSSEQLGVVLSQAGRAGATNTNTNTNTNT